MPGTNRHGDADDRRESGPFPNSLHGTGALMGVVDLVAAFNTVAEPFGWSASKATLGYKRASDTEWQILTFSGTGAGGVPFQIASDRLRPGTDVNLAAAQTAQRLLDQREPKQ